MRKTDHSVNVGTMRRGLVLLLVGVCASCARRPLASRQGGGARLPAQERYTPPRDGRLTESQVRTYLAVAREEAAARRRPEDASGDPFDAPEAAATRKLRVGLEEYRWVKEQVLDAEILSGELDSRRRNAETYRKTIASLRGARAASADPGAAETISRQVADLEQEAAENERQLRRPLAPAVAANLALVGRFLKEIEAVGRTPPKL